MQPVIKELELTLKCNSRWEKPDPYYSGVNAMCKKLLALIRDGTGIQEEGK